MSWDELRATYDRVADRYEARFVDELAGKPRDRELLAAFAAAADPVVEVGCGPGQVGAFVRQHGRRVCGVDLSPEMAGLAQGRLDGAVAGDLRSLPFASGCFGGLVAFYSVIHLPRPEVGLALREFHRVLRPGGRLLLAAHEGSGVVERDRFLDHDVAFVATMFELDELEAVTAAAGFEVTLAERRAPYPSESGTVRLHVEAVRPARTGARRSDGEGRTPTGG
jgi:SAM-dependent methyltransferase